MNKVHIIEASPAGGEWPITSCDNYNHLQTYFVVSLLQIGWFSDTFIYDLNGKIKSNI